MDKETLKTSHKNLIVDVYEAVTLASCVYCELIFIPALDCMALAINLLDSRSLNPDATLFVTLDQYAVLSLKRVV